MFGKRSGAAPAPGGDAARPAPVAPAGSNLAAAQAIRALEAAEPPRVERPRSDEYYQTKSTIFGALIVGGFGLPRWYLIQRRKKRIRLFTLELPNAVDVIVRGIRSGLPLNDCLRVVANELREPLRAEFRQVIEALRRSASLPPTPSRRSTSACRSRRPTSSPSWWRSSRNPAATCPKP